MQNLSAHPVAGTCNFLDYKLFSKALTHLPSRPLLINTINQYSFCMAQKDEVFKKSLVESDILLPDGIAVVVATRFLTGKKIQKIAGAEIHQHMLQDLNLKGGKCFYLGSNNVTLSKIRERIAKEYPNIQVGSYSPPYKSTFSESDNELMTKIINDFAPDVLFIGMTAPKQEKWASQNRSFLNAEVICTIGAVFDFYAGTVARPSNFWIKLGLEWFVRLLKEPRRMWKRYVYYGPVFLYYIMRQKLIVPKSQLQVGHEMLYEETMA